ncbi:hypothetical protein ACH4NT_04390 [Streptomyces lydicus]|uniref:hypothetical protein n=1 Tax=Streptomyces lydicus TaxID=47763 RepID=UPI0037A1C52D
MKPALSAAAGILQYRRLELEPTPRLGTLQAGAYIDRIVQGGEVATVDQLLPATITPSRFAGRQAQ